LQTTVRYHSFKYVTKYKTVVTKTWHPGGFPDTTLCVVTAIDDSGDTNDGSGIAGDGVGSPITAICTNPAYPGQTKTIGSDQLATYLFYDADGNDIADLSTSSVDEPLYTDEVAFAGYYTTTSKRVPYKVKTWTGYHNYVTPKKAFRAKDGGYARIWSGTGDKNLFFHAHASWTWAYDIYCGDYGYFGVLMNYSDYSHIGEFGPEMSTPYGESWDSGSYPWAGKVELDVFVSSCAWAIGVFSDQPLR
jgi:hypothetical protein